MELVQHYTMGYYDTEQGADKQLTLRHSIIDKLQ